MKFLSQRGYFVKAPVPNGPVTIGGRLVLPGAASPSTGLPLVQYASVRVSSDALSIPGWLSQEIHCLYSWTCNIHLGDFSYRQTPETVTVLEYQAGIDGAGPDFPYEGYPKSFRAVSGTLEAISEREQAIILHLNKSAAPDFAVDPDYAMNTPEANDLSYPRHQFGGVPLLLQSDAPPKDCIECRREMQLFASVGNGNYTNDLGFFGNDFVQILYWCCPACQIVSARNYCD